MTTTPQPRTPVMIDITTTNVVLLNIKASSIGSGLMNVLGYSNLTNGEVPTSKNLVGKGKTAALNNGCFGIWLKYAKTSTKSQVAKVLCSPTKADTVFEAAKAQTYAGKNIIEALIPRRRQLVF